MDPNLFAIDGERLFEVLIAIVVLSFFVERALALPFEHKWYVANLGGKGYKELISFGLALFVCSFWDFDALSVILVSDGTGWPGYLVTAAIIAGGSKASIKFFHDVIGVMSAAEKKRKGAEK